MKELIELIQDSSFSCILKNRGEIRTYTQHGVLDLYNLLIYEPDFLKEAQVADKVVGKGAAALMILGNIKELYTPVISELALALFEKTEIKVTFNQRVEHIINRSKTDWCPLERRLKDCLTVNETLPLITHFINEKNKIDNN